MNELISRDAAIKTFTGKPPEYYSTSYIASELRSLPTVDAVPVVHGRWNHIELYEGHIVGECSNCLKLRIVDNFCPNCGAKMDGERRDDDALSGC